MNKEINEETELKTYRGLVSFYCTYIESASKHYGIRALSEKLGYSSSYINATMNHAKKSGNVRTLKNLYDAIRKAEKTKLKKE